MNIKRYTLPVMIAASIHGSLFVLTPKGTSIVAPAATEPPKVVNTRIDVIDLTPLEEKVDEIEAVASLAKKGEPMPELEKTFSERTNPEFPDLSPDRPPVVVEGPRPTKIGPIGDPAGIPEGNPDLRNTNIFRLGDLDKTPNARVQTPPEYPMTLKHQGVSGSVVVEFEVNPEGRVVRATAVRSTHREFEEPALRAVRNWRFEGGRRQGRPVSFRMMIPIEFGLENN